MASAVLKAITRTKETPNSLRQSGMIPAIVYGAKTENQTVAINERTFVQFLTKGNPNAPFELELPSGSSQAVMIKDVQRHPARGDILHIDLLTVDMDQKITTTVTLHIEGENKATETGGILQNQLREVNVECLPQDLPEIIEVDISEMTIGDVLTVGELRVPDRVQLLDDPESVVLTVLQPSLRETEEEDTETEADEETVEETD